MGTTWSKKYPEKKRAYMRAYYARNPAKAITTWLVLHARERAKKKGITFSITTADIVIPDRCPLLDLPLVRGKGKQWPNSPSLDRIDNSRGYVPGNIWVISQRANAAKGDLTADELIEMGRRLKAMEALAEMEKAPTAK